MCRTYRVLYVWSRNNKNRIFVLINRCTFFFYFCCCFQQLSSIYRVWDEGRSFPFIGVFSWPFPFVMDRYYPIWRFFLCPWYKTFDYTKWKLTKNITYLRSSFCWIQNLMERMLRMDKNYIPYQGKCLKSTKHINTSHNPSVNY